MTHTTAKSQKEKGTKMADYLGRDAVLACFHDWVDKYGDVHSTDEMAEYRALEALTAADVVERKRGLWKYERMKHLLDGTTRKVRICSVCNGGYFVYDKSENVIDIAPNFCPNCGADMRGEQNE